MTLHGLAHYGLSGERGYLSQAEIDEIILPADFAEIENAAARLSGLVATGRIRHWLKDLPVPDMDQFLRSASDAQISSATAAVLAGRGAALKRASSSSNQSANCCV